MKYSDILFVSVMVATVVTAGMVLVSASKKTQAEHELNEVCRDRCWPQVVQLCSIDYDKMKLDTVYCFNADGGVERR